MLLQHELQTSSSNISNISIIISSNSNAIESRFKRRSFFVCFYSVSQQLLLANCMSVWLPVYGCNSDVGDDDDVVSVCCYASKKSHISKSKVKSIDGKEEKLEKSKNTKSSRKKQQQKYRKKSTTKIIINVLFRFSVCVPVRNIN